MQSCNLEGDEQCFVEEEVPAGCEAQCFINPMTGQSNKTTANRHVDGHFGDGIVHHAHDDGIEGVGHEKRAGAGFVESTTDTDEQSSADGASDGDQLNLAVAEVALQLVRIVSCLTMLHVVCLVTIVGRRVRFGLVNVHCCKGNCCVG